MPLTCGQLTAGVALQCPPPQAGLEADAIALFNYSDIDKDASTYNITNDLLITSVVRIGTPTPATGFRFDGLNNSNTKNFANIREGFNPYKFAHNAQFVLFRRDGATLQVVEELVGSLVIAFVFTKAGTVEVLGWDVGLQANVVQNEAENDGLIVVNLENPTGQNQQRPPRLYVGTGAPAPTFQQLKTEVISWTV
jgi:hypothetical protein